MNTISVAISRDEDAQHDLVLGFGAKGTIISGLSEADLLEIRSAIDCAISKGEDDAHARLIAAAPDLLASVRECADALADIIGAADNGDPYSRKELTDLFVDIQGRAHNAHSKATGGAR